MNTPLRLIFPFIVLISIFGFVQKANSQIDINETFMGDDIDPNIILAGNGSSFTARDGTDPIGKGWLRLTPTEERQKGAIYINKDLPSTLGLLIDFEYKSWRELDRIAGEPGGDGFVVFLYDALVPFTIGPDGGSMGYAASRGSNNGLGGGYIGIGFDEFGNFSNLQDGDPGRRCNSITLRGATMSAGVSNPYLTHTQLQPDINSTVNSICYPNITPSRPTDELFYRRVKIRIFPIGSVAKPKYLITVNWRTSPNGNDVNLLTYSTNENIANEIPPKNLKLGFVGATGGSVNYHEIRNLVVKTPVGFSVFKNVDKPTPKVGEKVTYTVNILNSGAVVVNNLLFTDSLKLDGVLPNNEFTINSITFSDNGNAGNTAAGFPNGVLVTTGLTNPFSTSLTIQPLSSSTFTVVGTVKNDISIEGKTLLNTAYIDASQTGLFDEDLEDNISQAVSTIAISTPDLKIQNTVDKFCADPTNGNNYTIIVSNNSIVDINKTTLVPIVVTDTLPAGFTVTKTSGVGWTASHVGNIYKFTRSAYLAAGSSFEPIVITVKPPTGGLLWENSAYVSTQSSIGETHFENNKSSITISKVPPTPLLNSPITYYQGDIATPLSTNKNLIWYTSLDSQGSKTAPTPATDIPGTTTYYVSQSNGSCESSLARIDVIVQESTSAVACDSYTTEDGKTYTTSGLKTVTGKDIAGNDSIYQLNLVIKHSTTFTQNISDCNSYTDVEGKTYTSSQVLTRVIQNVAGCDSTIVTNLTINQSPKDTVDVTAFDSYTASDGQVYTTSGMKTVMKNNPVGCDSIITIHLKINTTSSITAISCDTYTAPDGNVYSASGIITAVIPNSVGGDSIMTISLTVTNGILVNQALNLFQGETYTINGNSYTQAGEYTDVLTSVNGCDSTVVTTIKIIDFPNTITPNNDGKNDVFMPGWKVKVYNRNGILLYDGDNGWDGTHNGNPVAQDTYFFVLYLKNEAKTKEGYITVVR